MTELKPATPPQPKLKPLDVHIKSMNTISLMATNNMTGQSAPVFQWFGLGDDDNIYIYNNDTREWFEA